jgi:protein-tyrosine-phosphatase
VPRFKLAENVDECRKLVADFGWPLVVKPLSSFADDNLSFRQGVAKVYDHVELDAAAWRLLARGPVLVQECFVGAGVGVELLAFEGRVLAEFQHQRLHLPTRGGASSYRKSVSLSPELRDASHRVVAALNYTGVLMVEFLVNFQTGEWRFVETNARFWGSLPLAIAAGADFPFYLFQMLIHGQRQFDCHYRIGLHGRNLTADLHWARDNLRANHRDATLNIVPLGRMFRELANVVLLRERFDGLVCDDPWPGVVELAQFVAENSAKIARRVRTKLLHSALRAAPARRRGTAKVRSALQQAHSVLFVCLGNICRSPYADHLARRLWPAKIEISSSGLYPIPNRRSPKPAIEAAREFGVDLSEHRAHVLDELTISRFDVIFSFDESVHDAIRKQFPSARSRLYRFAALAESGPLEVTDPFGQSLDRFRAVYRQIAEILRASCEFLAVPSPPQAPSDSVQSPAAGDAVPPSSFDDNP